MTLLMSLAVANEAPPIVNGTDTSDFEAVGVLIWVDQRGERFAFCSGSLIQSDRVLTAAHCLDGVDIEDLDRSGYSIVFATGDDVERRGGVLEESAITAIHVHPRYDGHVTRDLAVAELETPLSAAPLPILVDRPEDSWIGEAITYVGWGLTGDDVRDHGEKRTVDVPILERTPSHIITYDPEGGNVCYGDSGGAAMRIVADRPVLVGVNSYIFNVEGGEPSCEGEGAAAGAARLDNQLEFIQTWADPVLTSLDASAPEVPEDFADDTGSDQLVDTGDSERPEGHGSTGRRAGGGCSQAGTPLSGAFGSALGALLALSFIRRRR